MTDGDRAIRVLIVDDHALLRDGLRQILDTVDGIEVTGEASNGEDAVRFVAAERPDVVVLDVEMPGSAVVTTVQRILAVDPAVRILILSVYDEPATVKELLALGVRGYLLKSIRWHDLVVAIRGVYNDDERVVLSISRESLQQDNGMARESLLSRREQEIMSLVAGAMSNAQIARRLSITEGTVKRHLRNIFTKLGAVSRIDAMNKAAERQQIPSVSGPRRPRR